MLVRKLWPLGFVPSLDRKIGLPPHTAGMATVSRKAWMWRNMMAELFGKATGTNRGKGGSMHITDVRVGMLGVNPIVGMGVTHGSEPPFRRKSVEVAKWPPLSLATVP